MRSSDRERRGFVLPTTIMVMTLMTVMLAAAFVMISAESRTTDNSFAMQRAYAIAQAGLQQYLGLNHTLAGTATYDSSRITLTGGYADVIARRLVDSTAVGGALWSVRSAGVYTVASFTGQTQATRVVGTLAHFSRGAVPAPAAFVAANPVVSYGTGPCPFKGNDGNHPPTNKPDLLVATGDYTGGCSATTLASRQAVLDSTHIDWASLTSGNLTPDYQWPTIPSWTGYPVGLVIGDLTFSSSTYSGGRGTLIVTGNLTFTAQMGLSWDGVILVGGWIKVPPGGKLDVNGFAISGLNNLLTPNSVGPDSIDNSSKTFQWYSTNAANAFSGQSFFTPVRGAWIDTWAIY